MKKLLACLILIAGYAHAEAPTDVSDPNGSSLRRGNIGDNLGDKIKRDMQILTSLSDSADYSRVTFYDPDVNNSMEGGPCTNRGNVIHKKGGGLACSGGEYLNSVEDSIKNHRPVSIAADDKGKFGKACNHLDTRCTVLIYMRGFDRLYPDYHKTFTNLPKDTFIGMIEDTGGDFHFTNGHRFDIAVRSRDLARSAPGFVNLEVHWTKLANPCSSNGRKGRKCEFHEAHLAPTVLAMLNLKEDQ